MEQTLNNKNTIKNAGKLFFILMILMIPISLLYGVLCSFIPKEYQSLFSILISQGYLLISAIIYLLVTKTKITRDLGLKKYKISSFFLSILVLMLATPMSSLLNIVSQIFAPNLIGNTMQDITNNLPIWLGILVIGCLPGFIEELIYRGILYSAFKKSSILWGIIISCLSFGLMHGNFNQIPYAIYLGVIFTLLVEATGSLASSMVLHMLFNGTNTLLLYMLPKLYAFLGQYDEQYKNLLENELMAETPTKIQLLSSAVSMLPSAIICLVLTILLLKKIAKMNGKTLTWQTICAKKATSEQIGLETPDTENTTEKPISGWLIAGWVTCILLAVLNLSA